MFNVYSCVQGRCKTSAEELSSVDWQPVFAVLFSKAMQRYGKRDKKTNKTVILFVILHIHEVLLGVLEGEGRADIG